MRSVFGPVLHTLFIKIVAIVQWIRAQLAIDLIATAGVNGAGSGDGDEVTQALASAYTNIVEHGSNPKTVLDVLDAGAKASVEAWLRSFYDAGTGVPDVGRAVLHGLRKGEFAQEGARAFALVAFLHGVDSEAKFNVLNIIGDVKN